MNKPATLLSPFSWSAPLGRGGFLASSAVAALAFSALLMLFLMVAPALLPESCRGILLLLLILLLFAACMASPFTIPMFGIISTPLMWLHAPELPTWLSVILSLLFLILTLAALLRLIALSVRRRRDAGRSSLDFFAFSGCLTALLLALVPACAPLAITLLLWLGLTVLQCCMLLLPTKANTPPAA